MVYKPMLSVSSEEEEGMLLQMIVTSLGSVILAYLH